VDLRSVIAKLRLSFHSSDITGPFAKHDPEYRVALEKICREASRAAEELVERLDKLKVKSSKHRRWNSFCQALEAAWSKEEIDALKGRLSSLKKALETRVLFSIRYHQIEPSNLLFLTLSPRADIDTVSILTSSRFDSLDKETRLIISSL
jgi:hypothetical protein